MANANGIGRHCEARNALRRRFAKLAVVVSGVCFAPLWWLVLDGQSASAWGTFLGLAIVALGGAVVLSRREVCPACRRSSAASPSGASSTTDVV